MFDQTNAGTSPPPSALHHPFMATTFPDISATSMQQATFTLATLAALIADTRATEKRHLPWIKLASLGSKRSAKGCLRTNANVLEIFGIEGDCDLGTVSVDQAERLLKRARLNGLVYTSASHTKEKPRFRVLVLTSRPLPPTERPKLMARVNGVLKGCLSRESDTLSQSYYMGQVDGVEFDLRLIDGDFVDQRPDLDAQAVSPKPRRADPPPSNTPPPPSEALSQAQRDKLVDRILGPVRRVREGSRHKERYDAGRHLAGVADELGLSDDDIVELVIEANPPDSDPEKEERAVRDGIDNGRAAPLSLGEQMSRYGLRPDKDFQHVIVVPPVGTQDGEEPTPPPPQPPRPPKPPGGGGGNGSAAPDDAEDGDAQSDDPSYEPSAINDGDGDGDGDEDIELPPHIRRTVAQWVNYLNHRYMVVCEAGRAMVYEQRHDPVRRRHYYVRITFDDLCRLYLNQSVQVGTNKDGTPIWENVAKLWLRHRDRRQYLGGLVFDPSRKNVPDDAYNLWRGFAVKPVHGSWDKIRSHIFHIVCVGQQHLYDYVLRWLARMVQFPSEQGHVVLVLQGEEGSGKGAFAQMITNMLGQHALAISNTKHLTGNFNAHLADCLFLFADEALAPDDKTAIGIIKALVTEPFIFIERKRSDGSAQPNYLHLVMASNNKHVVPAAPRSRRYVILQQPDTRIGDRVYFKALYAEINGDGIAAMLHDLLHMDISNFTVQDYPQTEGLDEQRKLSLPIELKWWHDCLEREFVYESKYGLDTLNVWESWKSTDILFASYETFAKGNRAPAMSREAFGKLMVKLSEGPLRASGREVIGEGRGEHTGAPTLTTKWRPTGYQLGTLAEARVRFANHTGLKLDWPDE